MLDRIADLVFPPRCGGCRLPGAWLCSDCDQEIRRMREPLCGRCGAEVESPRRECGCRERLPSLSRLRSAAVYDGPLERAVRRLKYEGWRPLARPLAGLLADRIVVEGLAASDLVAVPLHTERLRQRGYNQSELLARHLRRRLSLGRPPGRLTRVRPTAPQVGQDRRRRLENVQGAFRWVGGGLGGRPLLLVDDVVTTGATLDACAAALKAGGAGAVIGLTVARVRL